MQAARGETPAATRARAVRGRAGESMQDSPRDGLTPYYATSRARASRARDSLPHSCRQTIWWSLVASSTGPSVTPHGARSSMAQLDASFA